MIGEFVTYMVGLLKAAVFWGMFVAVNYALRKYVFQENYWQVVNNFVKYLFVFLSVTMLALAIGYGIAADSVAKLMMQILESSNETSTLATLEVLA
jgi:hypothetical protein